MLYQLRGHPLLQRDVLLLPLFVDGHEPDVKEDLIGIELDDQVATIAWQPLLQDVIIGGGLVQVVVQLELGLDLAEDLLVGHLEVILHVVEEPLQEDRLVVGGGASLQDVVQVLQAVVVLEQAQVLEALFGVERAVVLELLPEEDLGIVKGVFTLLVAIEVAELTGLGK